MGCFPFRSARTPHSSSLLSLSNHTTVYTHFVIPFHAYADLSIRLSCLTILYSTRIVLCMISAWHPLYPFQRGVDLSSCLL